MRSSTTALLGMLPLGCLGDTVLVVTPVQALE